MIIVITTLHKTQCLLDIECWEMLNTSLRIHDEWLTTSCGFASLVVVLGTNWLSFGAMETILVTSDIRAWSHVWIPFGNPKGMIVGKWWAVPLGFVTRDQPPHVDSISLVIVSDTDRLIFWCNWKHTCDIEGVISIAKMHLTCRFKTQGILSNTCLETPNLLLFVFRFTLIASNGFKWRSNVYKLALQCLSNKLGANATSFGLFKCTY